MTELFDFSSFPVLMTTRLRLRQITPEDTQSMMVLFGTEEMLRYLNMEPLDTPEKAIGLIDWLGKEYEAHKGVDWAITRQEDGQFVGMCGLYRWERGDRKIDLGYHIAQAHWGQGFATEAAHAIIKWAFEHLDVHRIQADCTDGNIASERVMQKCGFKLEGIWRESCWEHGRFVSLRQYGLLRHEYHPV